MGMWWLKHARMKHSSVLVKGAPVYVIDQTTIELIADSLYLILTAELWGTYGKH